MFFIYALVGIIGGLLGGMGMGGGTLLIPLLTIFLSVNQHGAQAINLISFIPMSIVALIIHVKNKLLKFDYFFYIVISGLGLCAVGCLVSKNIKGDLLSKFFGGFLVILSIVQMISLFKKKS